MNQSAKNELAKIGAKLRLAELDKERDMLLDFIGYSSDLKDKVVAAVQKKKKHWTQTPEGKRKLSKIMKAKYKNGWSPK